MYFYKTILVISAAIINGDSFKYDGYKVYRIQPTAEEHSRLLTQLTNNSHFDFWSPIGRKGNPVDVMVVPRAQSDFIKLLNDNKVQHRTLISNVERVIDEKTQFQNSAPDFRGGGIDFNTYYRHNEINSYLEQLADTYPNIVSLETIGKSYEGRDLTVIKISSNPWQRKPIIFIDAGIHAREWIAPAQALYIIQQLAENGEDSKMLQNIEWHVLPVVNPDGYEYSHTTKRFWRKTRSPTPHKRCRGTDGNRNFDFHWGETGTTTNECSEIYQGPHPSSEVEICALTNHLLRYKDSIKLYLSLHSYGSYILYPWGYNTNISPSNADELQLLGAMVARTIYEVAGTNYTVGSSSGTLYPAAGGSDDWAKGVAGIELAYTIELPGSGERGFNPPPSQIYDIVSETWEGIKVFHQYISNKFRK